MEALNDEVGTDLPNLNGRVLQAAREGRRARRRGAHNREEHRAAKGARELHRRASSVGRRRER